MDSNFRWIKLMVAGSALSVLLTACASAGALDGTYVQAETNPAANDPSSMITTLTIDGENCELSAETMPDTQDAMVQTCSVKDGALVFSAGNAEAAVPFEQIAGGDIRLGDHGETLLVK
ncbi:hypothetical protein, partial [Corynebacterium riegelii]